MGKFKSRWFVSAVSMAMLGAGLATLTAAPANAAVSCTHAITISSDPSGSYATVPGVSYGVPWGPGDCHLSEGSSGAGVKAMQRGLNSCYGAGLTADGQFGPKTRSALITVQKAIGVSADGIFGPNTRGTMRWMAFTNDVLLGCRYFRYA
ncbi:peptidoglycan-binding domain-containing protein [Saccharothrix sp. NRRL B-16314]|uniref:peptidoglycan-binding domain-containing protein n=1 Tax=Saccharothrix sp. NRRL B-16314 TaxID=1463825 RepID=UPI0005245D67|nr:peptidoglycan-binding domain-containing protein [Saccharothrix sp. NRRL B-16314]